MAFISGCPFRQVGLEIIPINDCLILDFSNSILNINIELYKNKLDLYLQNVSVTPRYDPDAPDALVMPRPSSAHQVL